MTFSHLGTQDHKVPDSHRDPGVQRQISMPAFLVNNRKVFIKLTVRHAVLYVY